MEDGGVEDSSNRRGSCGGRSPSAGRRRRRSGRPRSPEKWLMVGVLQGKFRFFWIFARLAHEGAEERENWKELGLRGVKKARPSPPGEGGKPPHPGPLLHKFVEEREKKRVVVVVRCARDGVSSIPGLFRGAIR